MTSPLTIDQLNLRLPASMASHAEVVADALSETLADLRVTEAQQIDTLTLGPLLAPADGNPRTLGRQLGHAIANAIGVET